MTNTGYAAMVVNISTRYNFIRLNEEDKIMRLDVVNEMQKVSRNELTLLNKSELARRMGCNRRTIDRYIKDMSIPPSAKAKREYPSILDPYRSIIIDKVDTYGATAMAVYKFIQKKGYHGRYGSVNRFVKQHRKTEQQKATIRFETTPGLQAQVDWKESLKMVNRKRPIRQWIET